MKRINLIITMLALFNISIFAQKTTIDATILNNNFTRAELQNSYGNATTTYASADIKNGKFTMIVDLPNDIYRLDFGNGAAVLLVLAPGEKISLTLDADNIQNIVSVSGSESIRKMKDLSNYSLHRKNALDSINNALQNDPDKIYWTSMSNNFNLFRQTNDDVDGYLIKAFENADSILYIFNNYMPNGVASSKKLQYCADELNVWLKKLDINYAPFASYLENVNKYYDFSGDRVSDAQHFYSEFDQYMNNLNNRQEIAKNSFGSIIPKVKALLALRDSLAFNNHLDKKSLKSWITNVYSNLHYDIASISSQKNNYEKTLSQDAQRSDALFVESQNKIRDVVAEYQQSFNDIDNYLTAKLKDGIKENKDDIGVLIFLDMFPREQNTSLHNDVISALNKKYPEHPIVKERWNLMNSPAGKTSIGSIAPELEFKNPEGKLLKLSDLRGKVVLIDFWASWCGPCRKENPNVTRIYNLYHDKGFEIYSVSLDSDANSWKRAIEQDKLVWPNHVSDLKKWQSQAAAIYGVRSIPATFLLDKDGRIVQKNLRGIELENAVKQLLEQ